MPLLPFSSDQTPYALDTEVEQLFHLWFAMRPIVMGAHVRQTYLGGLSATQFLILDAISQSPTGPTIGYLASRLGLDPTTIVRSVDALERRSLAQRRRDTHDRRQVFVELTEEGRSLHRVSREQLIGRLQVILATMSDQGRANLLAGLREFVSSGLQHAPERARLSPRAHERYDLQGM